MEEENNVQAAVPVLPPKGRAVAAKNWTAAEGVALINEAKALKIDDTTLNSDDRWKTLGDNVAKVMSFTAARSHGSNIDHFKAMVKVVRSMSNAYSMANAQNENAVQCPDLLDSSADAAMTEAYNEGSIVSQKLL
jgi:hypothetical protein